MSLSNKQFTYLNEMGITLWCSKKDSKNKTTSNSSQIKTTLLPISFNTLNESALFNDILHAIDCSIGEINITETMLSFDFFNWSFSDVNTIYWQDTRLVTPTISVITHSTELKKQLWHHLQQISSKSI